MSKEQDGFVRSGFCLSGMSLGRTIMSLISDAYTKSELLSEPGSTVPSWAAEVGRRLEVIAMKLGKDKSVRITERSWKQLQRYFGGSEVPASVVQNLATAVGATTDYVLDDNIITSGDAEIERLLLDNKIRLIREMPRSDELGKIERLLLDRSQEVAKIMAILVERPRRLKQLSDYLAPESALSVDPQAKAVLLEGMGILKPTVDDVSSTANTTASAVDEELLARIGEEIVEMYRQENGRISQRQLARLQARLYADLVAAYDDQAERLVGLKGLIQQLRRDLRAPPSVTDNSKRLA